MKKRNEFQVMAALIGLVKPLTGYMILAIIMGLFGHLCASFITILAGYALLEILGFSVVFSIKTIFFLMILLAFFRGILRYAEQASNHFIAFTLLALLRDKIFQALRRLSPAKLEGKDKGDLISIITSDIELLEVFYAHTISPTAIAFLFVILLTLFIGSFHWSLGILALIAYATIGIVLPFITSKLSHDNGIHFRNESGNLSSFVLDSLRGLSEILQYGQGKKRLEQMNIHTDTLLIQEEKMKTITAFNTAATNLLILFFDLSMFLTGIMLYQHHIIDFDGILIPTLALFSSFGPVTALAALGSTLQNTFAAGNRVLNILEETPAVKDVENQPFCQFQGARANNVTFAYDEETILCDLSIDIPKQSITGIVGKSGSGKSTLLKLFMRFWDVQSGDVSICDRPIHQINTTDLRNMESFMTQDTHLFQDSIANNVRIAKLDATQEEIESACKKASIHDFIMNLPQGYETPAGELGDMLSGGEKQRIGLARAFLHDAPFMLLDEPTSNLDSLNEAMILKSLHEERQGKTIILVSHRPSTMKIVDKIYAIDQGRMS